MSNNLNFLLFLMAYLVDVGTCVICQILYRICAMCNIFERVKFRSFELCDFKTVSMLWTHLKNARGLRLDSFKDNASQYWFICILILGEFLSLHHRLTRFGGRVFSFWVWNLRVENTSHAKHSDLPAFLDGVFSRCWNMWILVLYIELSFWASSFELRVFSGFKLERMW